MDRLRSRYVSLEPIGFIVLFIFDLFHVVSVLAYVSLPTPPPTAGLNSLMKTSHCSLFLQHMVLYPLQVADLINAL